ncbi:hypothetical protein TAF16_1959 [Anoxybacillus flavithermus]|uniref:Uncharacterized protein n=1 Tax=Anoxybacillus flavithermus TaxID=33934 RepID=A0A178TA06_9BACL|nr:hypothetical protein TAF16_1959 [Anoxybacillus flavithermus]
MQNSEEGQAFLAIFYRAFALKRGQTVRVSPRRSGDTDC